MEKSCVNPMEQFLILSKSVKGAAAVELIKQVLETPGVYVFGELLDIQNIKELANGQYSQYYNLLELFAYGKLLDYANNKDKFPALSNLQLEKLRHLTMISLATESKSLPYAVLLKELQFTNLRELEDLIISVICADIIGGKLDQKQQNLQVEYAIGRDVRPEDVANTISVLQDWCFECESVLGNIEKLAKHANSQRDSHSRHVEDVEEQAMNLRKSMKVIQQQEMEDQISMDLTSSTDKGAGGKRAKCRTINKPTISGFPQQKGSSK